MPAQPAAPTNSAETPRLVSALPRRRAASSVSRAQNPQKAAAPLLAQRPQVDSWLNSPCRNGWDIDGTDTVTGTARFAGTVTW